MMRLVNVAGRLAQVSMLGLVMASTALTPVALAQTPVAGPTPVVTGQAPAVPASPPPAPLAISESVAAVVNDEIISTYDLAQRMRLLIATSGVAASEQNLPQFQREALIGLVDERIQLQELKRVQKEQKIDIIATDPEVDDELGEMARNNNLSREQFMANLKAQGIGAETIRQEIRANSSWQRWIRGRYGSRLRVGDDQIRAAQERLVAAASKPQYQISEVFLDANRLGGMETAMNGATQLLAQMQQGAPFAAVARQFSGSASAASGGDVGWIGAGEMAPEVDAALEQMRPGQLSRAIQVRDGVYLIYLRDKRAGAGGIVVDLKQAAVGLTPNADAAALQAATATLLALRTQITGCGDLEAQAAKVPGVIAGDLGEAEVKDLAPAFREAAEALNAGQVSQPIRTSAGLHLLAVCSKRASGAEGQSKEQIESRLLGQQLSMVSRRYMRDLRNSATIETK